MIGVDLLPGSKGSFPEQLLNYQNQTLVFVAGSDANGRELWKADQNGIQMVEVNIILSKERLNQEGFQSWTWRFRYNLSYRR